MLNFVSDFFMEIVPQWISEKFLGKISDAVNNRIKSDKLKKFVNLMFFLLFVPLSIALALGILILLVWGFMLLNVI